MGHSLQHALFVCLFNYSSVQNDEFLRLYNLHITLTLQDCECQYIYTLRFNLCLECLEISIFRITFLCKRGIT